jgi:hypothetical protein
LQVQSTTVAQVPSPQIQATLAQTQKVSINDDNSYQANDLKLNNYSTLIPRMNQPVVNSVTFRFGGDSAEAKTIRRRGIPYEEIIIIGIGVYNDLTTPKDHWSMPDSTQISWEDTSRLCDKSNGVLRWHNGLKTCFKK